MRISSLAKGNIKPGYLKVGVNYVIPVGGFIRISRSGWLGVLRFVATPFEDRKLQSIREHKCHDLFKFEG
jgi:hypothetical protein